MIEVIAKRSGSLDTMSTYFHFISELSALKTNNSKWTGRESLEVWQWDHWPEPPEDWVAAHQRREEMDHECCIPRVQPQLKQGQHHHRRRVIWAEQTENRTTAQGFFFSDESSHCISFWNQGSESDDSWKAQNPICLKSRTFVHSVRIWASVFSATVGLLHFIMSRVNTASTVGGGDFRALYVSACWQALQRCWCPFLAELWKHPQGQNE